MKQTIKLQDLGGINPANIPPDRLNEVFENGEEFKGTLAELLLQNELTAVHHVDPDRTFFLGNDNDEEYCRQLLLGINYGFHEREGHSEGRYKIIVQNVLERKGPYVLYNPTGANEKTFYLEPVARLFRIAKPEFREKIHNPGKIAEYYLSRGNPLQIFDDFRKLGYHFVDEARSIERYEELEEMEHGR